MQNISSYMKLIVIVHKLKSALVKQGHYKVYNQHAAWVLQCIFDKELP